MHWDQESFTEDQAEQKRLDKVFSEAENLDGESESTSQDKYIGKVISQRYEILDLAGKGGMSVVYRAKHIMTQKIVALKLMHSHLLADDNAVRRFQQEAKAASRLHHQNAISVQDMGLTDDGQPFLTMDYLEGWSLSELIKTQGKIDVDRCLHIFIQACNALAHAHEQRIVHRDLKPSNVMLIRIDDDPDFVKVVDFGIAKILPEGGEGLRLTTTGEVFGSPLYMSPEQCMGHELDARSDVYSMGCLMYEALTGKVPHEGNNVLETMYKQTNLSAPTLEIANADPRKVQSLDKIMQKSMAKVPDNRYQNMIELRDDLVRAAASTERGSKLAANLGLKASGQGRNVDNLIGSLPARKLFWLVAVPLALVLLIGGSAFGWYWVSTSGDPKPSDRKLAINKGFSIIANNKAASEFFENSNSLRNQAHEKYTPEEQFYYAVEAASGFEKIAKYQRAIDECTKAKAIAASISPLFLSDEYKARIHTIMGSCSLELGYPDAQSLCLRALKNFKNYNVRSDAGVTKNLGNLLEIYSKQPKTLPLGIPYLQELEQMRVRNPAIDAVAYAQAADYVEQCARNNLAEIPVLRWVPEKQAGLMVPTSTLSLTSEYLNKSLEHWKQLETTKDKDAVLYNEGVIHNRLGLHFLQQEELGNAESEFAQAFQNIVAGTDDRNEAAAKVLFNLSDVQLKKQKWTQYYENHSRAKRIWADSANKHVEGPAI